MYGVCVCVFSDNKYVRTCVHSVVVVILRMCTSTYLRAYIHTWKTMLCV